MSCKGHAFRTDIGRRRLQAIRTQNDWASPERRLKYNGLTSSGQASYAAFLLQVGPGVVGVDAQQAHGIALSSEPNRMQSKRQAANPLAVFHEMLIASLVNERHVGRDPQLLLAVNQYGQSPAFGVVHISNGEVGRGSGQFNCLPHRHDQHILAIRRAPS